MLYPAQLYREELKRKLISCWYNPKYDYYFSGDYHEFTVPDNTDWRHDFVHLDSNGEVDGFFSYNYEDGAKSMSQFGLISFADNGMDLVLDAIEQVKKMFRTGAQRCEFWAFADNPVCKFYDKMADRFGGKRVGYLTRSAFFSGKYHDVVFYEFLAENLIDRSKFEYLSEEDYIDDVGGYHSPGDCCNPKGYRCGDCGKLSCRGCKYNDLSEDIPTVHLADSEYSRARDDDYAEF